MGASRDVKKKKKGRKQSQTSYFLGRRTLEGLQAAKAKGYNGDLGQGAGREKF